MIRAIIFDCFGVIKQDSFAETYKHFGGDPEKDEPWAQEIYAQSNSGKILYTAEPFAKRVGTTVEEWDKKSKEFSTINYDVIEYVKELRKKYKTALLTNIGIGGLEKHFLPDFLKQYFDATFASGDEGIAKPEARAYEITADRLGVRIDECVFIDDRQVFIDGATAVGMKAILYKNLEQLKKDISGILNS